VAVSAELEKRQTYPAKILIIQTTTAPIFGFEAQVDALANQVNGGLV
jgi:hypothetical protein